MTDNLIQKVFIEKGWEYDPYVQEILSKIPSAECCVIPDVRNLTGLVNNDAHDFEEGKKTLLLMENRGRFLKACPGTRNHTCCLYQVLHHAAGCPLDCTYCILQCYLNNPFIVHYVNVKDMLGELEAAFTKTRGRITRLGTGEYTDSLALEHITGTTRILLPLVKKFPDVFLEIKSKTVNIEAVLGCEPAGRLIFAWSLNPQQLMDQEEHGAASLEERLSAARKAQEAGHPVAFHFDPMLRFPGWEEAYRETVYRLAEAVDLEKAFWVSLGAFRFPPSLKPIIEQRFPENRLLYEEFITGADGKMRYFKPLRVEMFSHIVQWLKEACPDVFIYLCMERSDVWDAVFGFHPANNLELKKMLDERCRVYV